MNVIDVLINILIALVIAIATANLTIKGFYKQEIWLRKERKYSQLIEELCIIHKYFIDIFEEYCTNGAVEVESQISRHEYEIARKNIELINASSGLILDSGISIVIDDFKKILIMQGDELEGDYFSYYDRVSFELINTIEKIKEVASKDLRIKK